MPAAGPSLQTSRTAAGPGTAAEMPSWTWRGWLWLDGFAFANAMLKAGRS